jgi:hypothetical protein
VLERGGDQSVCLGLGGAACARPGERGVGLDQVQGRLQCLLVGLAGLAGN